ncbi:hypothetical protein ACLB2K_000775 [Fragaria x ananassa]
MAETEVPEDVVIFNILPRLPIKTLIRFTSVSKRWRFLILSDRNFARTQLRVSREHRHRLLLVTRTEYSPSPTYKLDVLNLRHVPSSSAARDLNLPKTLLCPLGSFNGLVFIVDDCENLCVLNPATGFLKQFPGPGFPIDEWLLYCGVGYLPAADDYKVAVAVNWERGVHVVIFSLLDRNWKTIETPGCVHFQGTMGTVLNEALHWVDKLDVTGILAFDLEKEEFRIMSVPDLELDDSVYYVGVYGGVSLCLLRYSDSDRIDDSIDFWVLTEYGLPDSWTKLFILKMEIFPNLTTNRTWDARYLVMEKSKAAVVEVPGSERRLRC